MAELRLKREFKLSADDLFQWISTSDRLLRWWGPEGVHVPEGDMDFSKTGPWFSVMENSEGQQYKVSGQVTHVKPPHSVSLTWAWHNEKDERGEESHVTFTVETTSGGSRLILEHVDLADDERAANHERGWTSSLRKLTELLN